MSLERRPTLQPAYFEDLYTRDPDPWGFRTSPYEAEKYATTLATLGRPRYGAGLEVGCSIGVLTRQLAGRCNTLLAIDASERALSTARHDGRGLGNVEYRRATARPTSRRSRSTSLCCPRCSTTSPSPTSTRLAELCMTWLAPDGEVLLCHWLGETDYPLTGDDAAALFIASTLRRWPVHHAVRRDAYRLDRLTPA